MVMKPPLATKMWRDTVGFGSRTNRVGTTRCRLRFALLGCVHVLLQVVLHRVRFLDHLYQNITPTRGPFRARRRLLLPCTTPSSLNQHHFRNGCPRRGLTLPIMVRWVCVYIGSNHDGTWYPRAAPWSSLTGEAILQSYAQGNGKGGMSYKLLSEVALDQPARTTLYTTLCGN
ncbi:hypothetical protein F2Q68_00015448 [Brassica cretica]|uniref:Uncharacterized protein n=1 Tax=Brassica cretica TaxID=69181 RepID=A0A8S9HL71_BRACR|nr:hypothetical protein F2Q68_00015448 [Brassica cretica]